MFVSQEVDPCRQSPQRVRRASQANPIAVHIVETLDTAIPSFRVRRGTGIDSIWAAWTSARPWEPDYAETMLSLFQLCVALAEAC